MTDRRSGRVWRGAAAAMTLSIALIGPAQAEDTPNYLTSPYHGVTDGNGNIIPCRCRFRGEQLQLGTMVCMETQFGTVLARCDLMDNNTSWIPTRTPCVMSRLPEQGITVAGNRTPR
jgi:hypothetical protein